MTSQVFGPVDFPLFSVEAFAGLIFLVTLAMVLSGALFAITCHRLVRAVAGLALSFTGLAGVYYFLLSPFVAMMQMLIYVGAVAILIAFAVMMARPEGTETRTGHQEPILAGPLGGLVAALMFAALGLLTFKTQWPLFNRANTMDIKAVGITLLTTHSMVFELISIVLLMAIIGALVIARRGRN
jgi:NADH:ubiquinone oxidoreductase subunit 6 (subunit J)